ncbi:F-box/WD repeat-containing protein 7 isoform X5 [Sitodiplosis mosellana]|uniref:F-box/WD repeat-containing protein 7 isoform X5 n=1 Tax=Sitodiplosis mosellana TaxID=263140 RepID=UPI0024449340|nr:F-box/WD repeat-containing protein 7 isoform X5 [Sitodiplosis mosellana]XP_055325025.1 F-box/WD repeat-containing protein 7 isoform X5 [Sitodiplosis mosellana]
MYNDLKTRMADKCTGFVKKQQEPKINDGEHKSSVTDDSTASTEVKTAINVDDKNAHNAKSMLSSVGAAEIESANVALASRTTAHIPSNDSKTTKLTTTATTTATATTTITTNTPNDIISSKTMNALDEITTSPSSSQASVVADIVMTESELMEMKESTTAAGIQSTATTPIHKGIESDYLNENENEADEISENGDNFLYETRANAEKVMYLNLETPVLDDNNEFMEVDQRQCHGGVQQSQPHYCKRGFRKISENGANFTVTKPKRLSDEFNSANDDIRNNQQLLPVVNTIGEKVSQSDLMIGEGSPDDNSNNASESEIVKLNRSSDIIDDDTSTSSLINIANKQPPIQEHMEDSSSPHSSMSPADVAISDQKQQMEHLSDVVEELTNHGDEHQQRSDHFFANSQRLFASSNQLYTNNDVQSMDAIERRDFINEQEATANCILGNSSLIINGTNGDEPRLNLDLLGNSFSQKMEQIAALTEEQTTKRNNADNVTSTENGAQNAISGNDQLITTPTTSRTKRSRLPFPGEKSTLARSLEKSSDSDKESSSLAWDASHRESPDTNSTTMPDALNHSGGCNCETDDVDGQQESTSKSSCSNCNKEPINEPRLDEDAKTDLDDDEDLDDDAGDHDDIEENGEPSSTSRANASRARCNGNSSCTSTCKNKHSNSDNSNQNAAAAAAAADLPANVSPSYYREAGIVLEDEDIKDYENETIDKNFRLMMGLEPENPYADWSCEVNSDGEEVCTCRDFTDNETTANSEDELPSRDVDLSCYSISADVLNSNGNSSTDTPTSRNHRKRKLTENRTSIFSDTTSGCSDANSNDRKRLALDETGVSHKLNSSSSGSQPSTPTSSSTNISLRTPRSVIPTRDNPPPELSDWLNQFKQWSHVERLVAVDRLIEHCEPTQVRHMMKVIEPQFQRDFISLLPEELALQVLSYLAPKDLLRAAQTCKSWRALCDDNLLWKEKCKQLNISIESSKDRPKRGRIGNMPPISSPWKAAYMRQHIIEMNWRSRPIREPKILKGHDDHVITCLQFCGNRIVSGSDDNTLKVWSAVTGKCLRTLVGHTGGVWSSQMSANIIISGSTDRTLKVWNADNGYCIHTLTGHTSTVRCMHLHEKKVVSGSRDATLRVWDIVQGKCLHTLVGHLAAVRCVQYDGKLVVSGAYDYMVKVWNPETEECLHTLQGHTNRVYSLQFDGVHVVSGSLDTSIRVWDAITGTCKHTLMGHQSLTSGMELRQNILVSGNADSTVKVWDTTNGQCLQTLSGPNKHQSAVTCLQFNSRFVITSSDDGTVKLWDVRTGEFIRNLVTLESGGSGGVVWRIRSNDTKLICAVGSRNGTEETKLMVLDFDVEGACLKCS